MITSSRSVLPVAVASLLFGVTACARQENVPPPVQASVVTSAPVLAPPRAFVLVSPNVGVSDDIAVACKLRFDDLTSAPKFDFDKSALEPRDSDMLSQIAVCVTSGPLAGRSLDLVGRADPRGEGEYDMALGSRRASSVGEALTELGVDANRIAQSSRGKLDATGTGESGWKVDRRVDIRLR